MRQWRRGARLGVDVGKVRVGVAICDTDGILATPLVTLARDMTTESSDHLLDDVRRIAALVTEHGVLDVVVGLPRTLGGAEGLAAQDARAYAERLKAAIAPVPVWLADERMSTVVASRRLAERGVRGRRHRAVVDQVAAAEILQGWLDGQRRQTR